jgi:polyhydroxybutyrate depolymerase
VRHTPTRLALALALLATACSDGKDYTPSPLVAARPYAEMVGAGYDPGTPTPLVILLHGYGASGFLQNIYFGLGLLTETRTFLYAYPDGTPDTDGQLFWNATDACCGDADRRVDDVAYVTAVIDDMAAKYNVDPKRIYVVGHSNGGFMSYRMACDRADRVAAIVSLAGTSWNDPARCAPSEPVSILHVHGDADDVIFIGGGEHAGAPYPSAQASVAQWAGHDGCSPDLTVTGTRDLELKLAGAETETAEHAGCGAGAVELWTIHGGSHLPNFQCDWAATILDWLLAHPKA